MAADCLPRLSPPAFSPASRAAMILQASRPLVFSNASDVFSTTALPLRRLPRQTWFLPRFSPHHGSQPLPVNVATRPLASTMPTWRSSRSSSSSVSCLTTSSALLPLPSRSRPRGPYVTLAYDCVAIAPAPARAHGTPAPTASVFDAVPTPHSLRAGS